MDKTMRPWFRRFIICIAILAIICSIVPAHTVHALAEGDGRLFYGQDVTNSSPNRLYNGGSGVWGTAADVSTDGSFSVRFVRAAGSPTDAGRMVQAHSNSNGQYRVHHWTGSSWVQDWTDSGGGSSAASFVPRFDLAYDNVGNAIMVYSNNVATTNEMSYRVFTGATQTWSAEQSFNPIRTTATVRMVNIVNRPGTDEFLIAWSDNNMDLSATYYDLSANTFSGEPAAAFTFTISTLGGAADPRVQNFDIAIEQASGDGIICWSNEGVTDLLCNTRGAGTGGAWAGAATTYATFAVEPLDMHLASDPDPSSNQIAIVAGDDLGAMNTAVWSGTAWGNFSALDTSIDTLEVTTTNSSIGWLRSGSTSQALVTYDDLNSSGIDWATYDPATTTWAVQTDITTAFTPASGNDKFHELTRNPLDIDEAMSLIDDTNNDLSVKKIVFNGTTFAWSSADDIGGASLETNNNAHGGWASTFAFYGNVPTPTLGVDVVDAGGVSVISPSFVMNAITSDSNCQTPTGTLGTASALMRVSNTTDTPGWSLTVAATGGAAANWSATTDSYDFNDSGGSGCTDGADSDSLPGQLSINPSGATSAVDGMCTTTGISLGTSSAFVEGVTDNITLFSASGSANTNCNWDLSNVALSQKIPPFRLPGSYSLQLTLTVTAN